MLYKYLPAERVDVLENLAIRFSPPLSLNDPFESQFLIETESDRNSLIDQILQELNGLWDDSNEKFKTIENRKLLDRHIQKLISLAESKLNPHIIGQGLLELFSDNLGVLSLSRTESNLLMWTHYADEGRGIVVGFDDSHSFFRERKKNGELSYPIPVVYSNKRIKVNRADANAYEKLLCRKPLDWSYEEEERIFRTFSLNVESIGVDQYGQRIILTSIPKEAIKTIYIGYRANDVTKERLSSAIKISSIDCTVYVSFICNNEYKLGFSKC